MKLKVALVAGLACLATQFVHADDCKKIKSQKERLACYDNAAEDKSKKADTEAVVTKFKQLLTQNFFDPDSAKFRNLTGYGFAGSEPGSLMVFPDTGTLITVCGEVNAKNRSGGYVGYRRFFAVYSMDKASIEEPSDEPSLQELNDRRYGDGGVVCKGPVVYKQKN